MSVLANFIVSKRWNFCKKQWLW